MAWAKRKAMTWEWFSFRVKSDQIDAMLNELSELKHKISFVLPWNYIEAIEDGTDRRVEHQGVLIITVKGTPVPTVKKTKEASE